jgi:hypothetical protein
MTNQTWLPRPLALVAAVLLLVGTLACGSKGSGIPTSPPLAPTEPHMILEHLKYLAVRKDFKHVVVIAPVSREIVMPSAWWFHKHATDVKVELSDEDLRTMGIEHLKSRLSNLPRLEDKEYSIEDARLAFNAGMFRLVRGIPDEAWAEISIMEIKPNAADPRVKDVLLGLHGKPIMKVSCVKKNETSYGISMILYVIQPGSLKKK